MGDFGEKFTQLKLTKIDNIRYKYKANISNLVVYSLNMCIFVLSLFITYNIITILLVVVR